MKFPKEVFVKWEQSSNDPAFLLADETESSLAERDESEIGVYVLKEVHKVKLVTTTRLVTSKSKVKK